jgi:alkylation response protein AidB-like acyl-CoA dehydrogenase
VTGLDDAVLRELGRFLDAKLPGFKAAFGSRTDFEACLAWHRLLHEGGFVGLNWPTEYGGKAVDLATQVACETALGAAGAPPIAGFIGVNTVASAIMQWGSAEQKAVLPKIRSGEVIYCQGFSEPGAGSDLASLRTRADQRESSFVLNGQKVWTSHGAEAKVCLVLARTTPVRSGRSHKGLSLLLVPLDSPGVTVTPIRQLTGNWEFAEIFFDNVEVPADALVGPIDQGWKVAMSTLAHERAAAIVLATRTRAAVRATLTKQRDSIPAKRRDAALQLFVAAEILGILAERSLAEIGSGHPGPAQSVVKLAWSTVDQHHADLAVELRGADAVAGQDPEAAEALLFSRSSTIAAGTTEVMRTILAEQVLGLPR